MNPYFAATLAMCGVISIALAATAWLAVLFTRRAKTDLHAALTPLAEALGSAYDAADPVVTGRFRGYQTTAQVTYADDGPVRVFRIDLADAAGGESWRFVRYPRKGTTEVRPEASPVVAAVPDLQRASLADDLGVRVPWFQVDYLPEKGQLRLILPMDSRKDIPSLEAFQRQLDFLSQVAQRNREIQEQRDTVDGEHND